MPARLGGALRLAAVALVLALSLGTSACTRKAPPPETRVAPVVKCSTEWLAALGFDTESTTLLQELATQVSQQQTVFICNNGAYLPLDIDDHIQLWFQRNREGFIVAATPHYTSPSNFESGIVRTFRRDGAPEMAGSFFCWLNPDAQDPATGQNPVVFDCPAAELDTPASMPLYRRVQMVAIAQRITAYPNEQVFRRERTLDLDVEQIYPQGLYVQKDVPAPKPPARVTMTARVIDHATRTNPTSGLPYLWARVRTHGRAFDLVAQPSVLQGKLERDGVIVAVCELSGRVLNH